MKEEIQKFFKGEIFDDDETLGLYSRDASLFAVRPKLVVWPKDTEDLKHLVKWAGEHAGESITIRAGGSDMSGGPLNESIIADVTKHINKIGEIEETGTLVEPGAFYRDFEKRTLEKGLILPCFPASKNLCALGGQIANNGAGEKTLRYGKMEDYVLETKVIFSDGREYEVKPLTKAELDRKMSQNDFEGELYKKIYELIITNYELIKAAKPNVSKNSAGYYLWNVWDGTTFDLNKLIVGSQGTLGIVTEAKIKLVPVEPKSRLFVVFLPNLEHLAELVNDILPTAPESLEAYDDATMKLAWRFFPELLRSMKVGHFFKLALSFIPEALMMLRGGIPKLILLVEYTGRDDEQIERKMKSLRERIGRFHFAERETRSEEESRKYWAVRRESFNLLRKHIKGLRTAPFVDDVVVKPEDMPKFLPEMRRILDRHSLVYTIAGHAGNGNFHVIPLMDMRNKKNIDVIRQVSDEVYNLVGRYGGSITGEHNDGLVRTPYLGKMYAPEVLELFKQTKDIFDPKNIFNPRKKVGGSLEYSTAHVAIERVD